MLPLAIQHIQSGRFDLAKPILQQLVASNPNDARAVMYLMQCHAQANEFPQAEFYGQRCTQLMPDALQAHTFYAKILLAQRKRVEASVAAHAAIDAAERTRKPFDPATLQDLAWIVAQGDDYLLGLRFDDHALRFNPRDYQVLNQRAHHLGHLARLRECRKAFLAADQVKPGHVSARHGIAWAAVYDPDLDPGTILDDHRKAGQSLIAATRQLYGSPPPPHPIDPAAGVSRPLRVGLLSGDFRRHSCAYFLRPLLQHAALTNLDLRLYSFTAQPDDMTDLLRAGLPPDAWLDISKLGPAERAAAIRDDRPDVLLCCSGFTVDEAMAILAIQPAAVQVDYLGYPHSTGLPTVGYRLVDSITDPEGARPTGLTPSPSPHATELLVPLDPCFICYQPPDDTPPVAQRQTDPATPTSPITFISCNNAMKHNDRTFRLWARVLNAVPGSRLIIKTRSLEHPGIAADTAQRLKKAGIDPARTQLTGWLRERSHHLAAYAHADIALDPFPYHGTTTTCEALLMGLPVVSLSGDRHASRVGASILSAVGHPELIAHTEDDYVRIAADLASDQPRRAALRTRLRDDLLNSPLTDGPAFATRMGHALRAIHAHAAATPRSVQS